MIYDFNLTRFYYIKSIKINFKHFILRHKKCVYYYINQIERLDIIDLRKLYNIILKLKNIMFFKNFASTRINSRNRIITNLNVFKLEMTIYEIINNKTSFLKELLFN